MGYIFVILLLLLFFFSWRSMQSKLREEKKERENEIGRYESLISKYLLSNMNASGKGKAFLDILESSLQDEKFPKNFLHLVCLSPSDYGLMKGIISFEIDYVSDILSNKDYSQDEINEVLLKKEKLHRFMLDLEEAKKNNKSLHFAGNGK